MIKMVKVVEVESVGEWRLRIRFSDGSEGVHDFAALVAEDGEMLQPLKDAAGFARVHLEYGALTWPNGYDMCPDWLRQQMEATGELRSHAAAE